jgi:hypothetical protein
LSHKNENLIELTNTLQPTGQCLSRPAVDQQVAFCARSGVGIKCSHCTLSYFKTPHAVAARSPHLLASHAIAAVEHCGFEQGGGICPDGNACCRMQDGLSGCIASDMGSCNATCCPDGSSGCPVGCSCRNQAFDCLATGPNKLKDDFVKVLPRYKLCRAKEISQLYGLSVDDSGAQLAHCSSHGPIESMPAASETAMVFIFIHGANRNADDYFCSGSAAVQLQTQHSNVLLISPRFFEQSDAPADPSHLVWEDDADGSWRYGADSIAHAPISSSLLWTLW